MSSDVYFTCPECGHTILTEMGLVGKTVECPDCQNEVSVPLIRDGRNPRLRHRGTPRRGSLPPAHGAVGLTRRAGLVQKGLVSLERRQSMQVRKLSHLAKSLALFSEQLQELEIRLRKRPPAAPSSRPAPAPPPPHVSVPPGAFRGWDRVAMAAAGLVIAGCVAAAVYWLSP
jgi:hypothetical protein